MSTENNSKPHSITVTELDLKLNPELVTQGIKEGDEIQTPKNYIQLQDNEILLSDGRVAKVLVGKGKDMLAAQEKAGQKTSDLQPILMQQLVVFRPDVDQKKGDHAKVAIEDFLELPMKDFSAIQVKFATINF